MANMSVLSWATDAVYWRLMYEDANPEVGMAPSCATILEELMKAHGSCFSDGEKKYVLRRIKSRLKKNTGEPW